MKFLESLYSNENFGIYLFAIIALLVILFFVILFFGKKDEKVSKKKAKETTEPVKAENPLLETPAPALNPSTIEITPALASQVELPKEEELPKVINGFQELTEETPLEVHTEAHEESLKPVIEEKEEPLNFSNVVLNSNLVEEQKEPEKEEEKEASEILKKEFDFDALADAISKELDTINRNNKNKESIIEEKEERTIPKEEPKMEEKPFVFPTFEPVKPDLFPEEMKQEEPKVEKRPEPKERPVMPTVFSSVYVNRDTELKSKPNPESERKEEKEEPHPMKPQFELPKMVDLPKRIEPETKEEPKETFTINNEFKN